MLINVWFSGIHTKKCSFLDHVRPQKIMFSHVNFLFFAYFASEKCSFMNHTCSRSTSWHSIPTDAISEGHTMHRQ